MKRELVIIKLGGSVITDKNKSSGVLRATVLSRLAGEVASVYKKGDLELIIAHGAGSYGHPLARKYGLDKGYINEASIEGFAKTRQSVRMLNLAVVDALVKSGINASGVDTSAVAGTKNKKITNFNVAYLKKLLRKRIVPVLFGDAVFDAELGFAILSADQIVTYLAKKFKAREVIFVSDVDGVYSKNPQIDKNAKLIKLIDNSNYREIIMDFRPSTRSDVSGEMMGKIYEIKRNLKKIEVQIINGFELQNLFNAMSGKNMGTRVIF